MAGSALTTFAANLAIGGKPGANGLPGPPGPANYPRLLNVVAYGADPTGANDSTSAVAAAVADVLAGKGEGIWFPAGSYSATGIDLTGAVDFTIDGSIDAQITATGSSTFLTATGDPLLALRVRNIQITNNSESPVGGVHGISVPAIILEIDNVYVQGFDHSYDVLGARGGVLIYISRSGSNASNYGVYSSSLEQLVVIGCYLLNHVQAGVYCTDPEPTRGASAWIGPCTWRFNNIDVHFSSGCVGCDASSSGMTVFQDDGGGNLPASWAPSTIASASTIAPTYRFTEITGVAEIQTVTVPSWQIPNTGVCELTLLFQGAASFGTDGNIARAATFADGDAVRLVYNPSTSEWYF